MIKYIDTHAHMNFSAYDEDRDEVIKRALNGGVGMINVGTMEKTSREAIELSEKYENVYAIIGLHPVHVNKSFHDKDEIGEEGKAFTSKGEEFDYNKYLEMARHPKVVAIGECGLDFFRVEGDDFKPKQIEAFIKQIEIALEVDKPLMIHCREAYPEVLAILSDYKERYGEKLRGNFHFFAGELEDAQIILDLGFTMSFTGVVTFAKDYEELVKFVPLEKMMSETDCPYVTPVPYRGQRNEPLYVKEVVKKIAELKELDEEVVREQLIKNAIGLYKLS